MLLSYRSFVFFVDCLSARNWLKIQTKNYSVFLCFQLILCAAGCAYHSQRAGARLSHVAAALAALVVSAEVGHQRIVFLRRLAQHRQVAPFVRLQPSQGLDDAAVLAVQFAPCGSSLVVLGYHLPALVELLVEPVDFLALLFVGHTASGLSSHGSTDDLTSSTSRRSMAAATRAPARMRLRFISRGL